MLNIGVIGLGFIGKVHIETIKRLGFVNVVAIADRDESIIKKISKKYQIPNIYNSYHNLLANKTIDVVHNCTPNYLHYEINKDILNSGKHIVSEKPLTLKYETGKELIDLVNRNKNYHLINFNYRQYPLIKELKSRITKSKAGKIYIVHGHYLQDWLLYNTDYNWRVDSSKGGKSRAIADIGSHWCDLAQYVVGEKITKVFSQLKTIISTRKKPENNYETFTKSEKSSPRYVNIKIDTEDYATVIVEFESGIIGNFIVSQVSAGHKNDLMIEFSCEKSSYRWSQEEANKLHIGYKDKPNEILLKDPTLVGKEAENYIYYPGGHIEGWSEGIKNTFKNFYNCIINNDKMSKYDFANFYDGLQELKITEAILKSSNQNRWVEIN